MPAFSSIVFLAVTGTVPSVARPRLVDAPKYYWMLVSHESPLLEKYSVAQVTDFLTLASCCRSSCHSVMANISDHPLSHFCLSPPLSPSPFFILYYLYTSHSRTLKLNLCYMYIHKLHVHVYTHAAHMYVYLPMLCICLFNKILAQVHIRTISMVGVTFYCSRIGTRR